MKPARRPSAASPATVLAADPPLSLARRPHRFVEPRRLGFVDQPHRSLRHALGGDECVAGVGDHVDDRIADRQHVEAVCGHESSGNRWKRVIASSRRERRERATLRRASRSCVGIVRAMRRLSCTPSPVVLHRSARRRSARPRRSVPAPQLRGGLIGLTAAELVQRLGSPALQIREGQSLKLQFRSPSCILDAYLYRPAGGQGAERVDPCRHARALRRRHRPERLHRCAGPALKLLHRPVRGFRDHRIGIVEMRPHVLGQARIAAIARRDQAIADHPVAPDALDRRSGEHLPERRIVERQQIAKAWCREFGSRQERAIGLAPPRRSCSTGRPPGNRRSRRCGCRSPREIPPGSALNARWSDRKCSAAHRSGWARRMPVSGRRRGSACSCRNAAVAGASGSSSRLVRMIPRNSQLPCSRLTRLVCLPCQPMPAAALSGFSITGAVSTNTFSSRRRAIDDEPRQRLQRPS